MGVSPWFYTDLPQYDKNWYFASDSLWYDRWQQVIALQPDLVEIITWNDFGESSYIGDVVDAQIVSGAEAYVDGYSHSAFRSVLPYFISAYKSNDAATPPAEDTAVAWYRTTPAKTGPDGGTIWGQTGSESAADGAVDCVSVLTVTVDEQDIVVSIGGNNQTFQTGGGGSPAKFFEVPFAGMTGDVQLYMGGRMIQGPAITNTLPSSGYVNFNAVTIGF